LEVELGGAGGAGEILNEEGVSRVFASVLDSEGEMGRQTHQTPIERPSAPHTTHRAREKMR
jgi:hypothetical protein